MIDLVLGRTRTTRAFFGKIRKGRSRGNNEHQEGDARGYFCEARSKKEGLSRNRSGTD